MRKGMTGLLKRQALFLACRKGGRGGLACGPATLRQARVRRVSRMRHLGARIPSAAPRRPVPTIGSTSSCPPTGRASPSRRVTAPAGHPISPLPRHESTFSTPLRLARPELFRTRDLACGGADAEPAFRAGPGHRDCVRRGSVQPPLRGQVPWPGRLRG